MKTRTRGGAVLPGLLLALLLVGPAPSVASAQSSGAEDAPLEPTRVDVEGDVLTLYFPSGNRMTFVRAAPE